MCEFREVIKNGSIVQNQISQTNKNYEKQSGSTQSELDQKALIKSKVNEQPKNIMGTKIKKWI